VRVQSIFTLLMKLSPGTHTCNEWWLSSGKAVTKQETARFKPVLEDY
jgi:hypothetical protein